MTMYVKVWAAFCCLCALISLIAGVEVTTFPTTPLNPYKILGGSKADDYSQPQLASFQFYSNGNWKHFCGAVLIATDKLVTAAHCLNKNFTTTRIVIGAMDIENDGPKNTFSQTRIVGKRVIHPRYKQPGERNDIGVIYLNTPVTFNRNVKVAQMAPKGSNFDGENCVIAGWGISEEFPQGSSYLRAAFLKPISTAKCSMFNWDKPITDKEICLFDDKFDPDYRARSCQGDSGGSLMCGLKYRYLAGITSAGGIGCTGTKPSIYTRVSEYIDWINSV